MKELDKITVTQLKQMAEKMFEGIVKADVDIAKGVVVFDMPMHVDGEAYLLEKNSHQQARTEKNIFQALDLLCRL